MRVLLLLLPLALGGCLVRTAADVVTMPVKAVGWTADKLTTSQSEADEKRGREIAEPDFELGSRRAISCLPNSGTESKPTPRAGPFRTSPPRPRT